MYAVAPGASAAWNQLFEWLADASGVKLDIIDHAFPASLESLWMRDDLGAAFMCGWPFARTEIKPRVVAAPIPAGRRYGGRPDYFTDFVVRVDSAFATLPDTFGHRLAYTAAGSHSGFNAVRHHLATNFARQGPQYRAWIGPLTTPRRVVDAILAGDAEVGPLDSYAYDLLRRHEPDLMTRLRLVDSTVSAPMPALIASRATPEAIIDTLRATLLTVNERPELTDLRDRLCLAGFGATSADDYNVTRDRAASAEAAGYCAPNSDGI
jgi:ABC-type phosphate/phosphonate transport system substrate-binding protein